jgi:ubiquitin carboxyl-terminal hydrolase 6/32
MRNFSIHPLRLLISIRVFSSIVVRLDGSQPVRYGLKLEVDDKYRAILATLSRLTGIKKSNLLLVEMFGATIRVSSCCSVARGNMAVEILIL